jgi:acyl carrier protein
MSEAYAEVVRMITEVVGDDFLLDTEITPDTTFSEDLALESIELVMLGEQLRQLYGDRVNLVDFIAEMEIDDIMAMTVGSLASYVEAATAQAATTERR